MLGIAGFIPAVLAAPVSIVGGILADQVSRRKVIIIAQSLMVIPPIVLALLIWTGQAQIWHVIAATSVLAIVAAADIPSRVAIVPQLVGPDDLLNAQGLTSSSRQVARIVGPVLAGAAIAAWSAAVPYLINGVTYLAMVIGLLLIRPTPIANIGGSKRIGTTLAEAGQYILGNRLVLGLLVLAAAQGIFLNSYVVLLPVFAIDVWDVGPSGLGWLNAAVGAGSLVGSIGVANLGKGKLGRIFVYTNLLMSVVLIGFAWSNLVVLALAFLIVLGMGMVVSRVILATMILTVVPDRLRGRVGGLAALLFLGAPYIGGLPGGYLTENWGASVVLSISAAIFLVILIVVIRGVPQIRNYS